MAFTKKKKYSKKRSYKRKSFSKKRTYTKKRRGTKKRSYVKHKRAKGSLGGIRTRHAPMYLIPKTADRLTIVMPHKLHMMLTWASTAERFIGTVIDPTVIGVESLTQGPFSGIWPTGGTNVSCSKAVADISNFLVETANFQAYYVSGVDINVKVTRQSAGDDSTIMIGMMPLNKFQRANLVQRDTAASPLANLNYVPPGYLISSTSTSVLIPGECINSLKSQPNVRMRTLMNPQSGKPVATVHQKYGAKKVQDVGFPNEARFQGTCPQSTGSVGTSPVDGHAHYFFMMNDLGGAGAANQNFDIEFNVNIHVTLFRRTWVSQNAVTRTESKEEKKDDEEVEEDLIDVPQLSLSSLSMSSPLSTPVKPLATCLNPKHPPSAHTKVSTCV